MLGTSELSQIASLVTVRDICEPFIGKFDANRPAAEVAEEWSIELCVDSCPLDHLGLVLRDGRAIGIVDFSDLENGKILSECAEPIALGALITEDTPLVKAAEMFADHADYFFVVIRGNELVGWLSYHMLHKLPFRLCLFAALLGLEEKMLRCVLLEPEVALSKLSADQTRQLRGRLQKRHPIQRDDLKREVIAMAALTGFTQKATCLAGCREVVRCCPSISEKQWRDLTIEVRNALAHPDTERHFAMLVERGRFAAFMDWLGRIDREITAFLEIGTALDTGIPSAP